MAVESITGNLGETADYPVDNRSMAQGKRISLDIPPAARVAITEIAAAAKQARLAAGEGQSTAANRLGVHVQTIARIEHGEPGVAIGHVLGMLALYGISVKHDPARETERPET